MTGCNHQNIASPGSYSLNPPESLDPGLNGEFDVEQIIEYSDLVISEYLPEGDRQGVLIVVNRCDESSFYQEIQIPYRHIFRQNPFHGEITSVFGAVIISFNDRESKVVILEADKNFAWDVHSSDPITNETWTTIEKSVEDYLYSINSQECEIGYSQKLDEWIVYGEIQYRILRYDLSTDRIYLDEQ